MTHSFIEIEIKLPLHNPDEVKAFLEREGELLLVQKQSIAIYRLFSIDTNKIFTRE